MTVDILIWIATIICLIAGAVFVFLPVIPGTLIAYAGVLIFGIYDGFARISITTLVILGIIALAGTLIDNVLNFIGAKAFGASWAGLIGVLIGGILGGLLLFPVGLLIGPFVGALLAELIGGRTKREALKAGLGAFLGYLGGVFAKLAIWAVIAGWFLLKIVMTNG